MKCFTYHKKQNVNCQKKDCRYWINCSEVNKCTLIASKNNNFTLEDIGEIFKVTRMRICQIEKNAIKKIKNKLSNMQ